MSAPQTPLSFGASLAAALGLSVCGAAVLAMFAPIFGAGIALRIVIGGLGFAYVLFVLARSRERVGRVTTVVLWLVCATAAWFAGLPLAGYALVHVALVWLVRSLYHYSSVLAALADFGLGLLGAAFAAWAAQRSGSAWLAFWCFFLAQSFHVLIPASFGTRPERASPDDTFSRAHRAAQAAVRRLSTAR